MMIRKFKMDNANACLMINLSYLRKQSSPKSISPFISSHYHLPRTLKPLIALNHSINPIFQIEAEVIISSIP
jgi:hypothetical protein